MKTKFVLYCVTFAPEHHGMHSFVRRIIIYIYWTRLHVCKLHHIYNM